MSSGPQIQESANGSLIGSIVDDRYRIDDYLGEGAMGAVFKATQLRLQREVAIKVPLPQYISDEEYRFRFKREALAMAKVHHENVVSVFDVCVALEPGEISYLVLEFVEGTNLDVFLRREQDTLNLGDVLDLFAGIANGLQAAHRVPVMHRDIKPSNIIITNEDRVPKILDFGVAKFEDTQYSTVNPMGMGTPVFMAPEQLTPGKKVCPATDVYAFTMTIYRELARADAFDADNAMAYMFAHVHNKPKSICELNPNIPESADAVLQRGLAKDPDERYQSAPELVEALREALVDQHAMTLQEFIPGVDQTPPRQLRSQQSTETATDISRYAVAEESTAGGARDSSKSSEVPVDAGLAKSPTKISEDQETRDGFHIAPTRELASDPAAPDTNASEEKTGLSPSDSDLIKQTLDQSTQDLNRVIIDAIKKYRNGLIVGGLIILLLLAGGVVWFSVYIIHRIESMQSPQRTTKLHGTQVHEAKIDSSGGELRVERSSRKNISPKQIPENVPVTTTNDHDKDRDSKSAEVENVAILAEQLITTGSHAREIVPNHKLAGANLKVQRIQSDNNIGADDTMHHSSLSTLKPPYQPQAPQPIIVRAEGDGRRQGWAVLVGISDYKYNSEGLPDLSYAHDDADALAFELKSRFGWSDSHMQVLLDQDATKSNVEYALDDFLRKADSDDFIIFYWSGQAYSRPDNPSEVYFACHDTNINRLSSGYDTRDVKIRLKERNVSNVIIIADTIHSSAIFNQEGGTSTRGEATSYMEKAQEGGTSTRGEATSYMEKAQGGSNIPPGWIYMVSAASDRLAVENSTWKNGAFTHFLLRGLRGEADNYRGRFIADGRISMREMREFLTIEMPEQTFYALDIALFPTIESNSNDPNIWQLTFDRTQ